MLVSDFLNSFRHFSVAEAAVGSIGGPFADRVRRSADATGLTVGEFTALNIRRFSTDASERDWRLLTSRMRGEDLALLTGLQLVLQRMMPDPRSDDAKPSVTPATH